MTYLINIAISIRNLNHVNTEPHRNQVQHMAYAARIYEVEKKPHLAKLYVKQFRFLRRQLHAGFI